MGKRVRLFLDRLRQNPAAKTITLSFEPENTGAAALYASLGFVATGEVIECGRVLKLSM